MADSSVQKTDQKEKDPKTKNAELEEVLSAHKTVIKVFGCGGAGNNTLTRLSEVGVKGVETIAVNTDAQNLLYTVADNKILIGRNMTNGLGAGSDPKIGEDSALESQAEIKSLVEGADMVFITCGLGGGTGTGSAPVIADISKSVGALTIAIVTLPFSEEGSLKKENATQGLQKLRQNADTVIVIQNDRLLDIVPDLPLNAAFKVADEILVNAVKGITELVTEKGLINLDFADVKSVMQNGDTAMIGIGESDSENKAADAVEKAITNPLLDVEINGAKCALINVTGDENMSIREARSVMTIIAEKLDPEAKIIWGARIDEQLKGTIRVLLIATGLQSIPKDSKKILTYNFKQKTMAEKKDEPQLFDIKEPKEIQLQDEPLIKEVPITKEKKKTKKVFTEIFEEEIKGDLNILKETVKEIDNKKPNNKTLNTILKACTSMQSSSQLFSYEKIEEFTIFISDIIEGLLSGEINFHDKLIPLFKKIPSIIEGMVINNKVALPEAQEFIENITKVIDEANSKKITPAKKKIEDKVNVVDNDELYVSQEDMKRDLEMELK